MNKDATMNEKCWKYQSLNRFECREKLIEDLKEEDILIEIEEIARLENSIPGREKLLSNENYVKKAPKNIVDAEREQLEKEKKELETLKERLK